MPAGRTRTNSGGSKWDKLTALYKQGGFTVDARLQQLDKLEFGGGAPLTIRARCSAFRYCPDPLGIVTAEQLDKLEFT